MSASNPRSCHETFKQLDDFLDRELSDAEMEIVRKHLEECAHCACRFEFEGTVVMSVREKLARIDVPDDFKERVFQRLRTSDDPPPS